MIHTLYSDDSTASQKMLMFARCRVSWWKTSTFLKSGKVYHLCMTESDKEKLLSILEVRLSADALRNTFFGYSLSTIALGRVLRRKSTSPLTLKAAVHLRYCVTTMDRKKV